MGNRIGKIGHCFAGDGDVSRRYEVGGSVFLPDPLDEGYGHSFCYIRPEQERVSSSHKVFSEDDMPPATTFRSISGASVSANNSTPLSTSLADLYPYSTTFDRAAAFDCSNSFASIPLQPVPRYSISGNSVGVLGSGPIERVFLSGPMERSFTSGPLDRGLNSGLIAKGLDKLERSFSHNGFGAKPRLKKRSLIRILKRALSKTISRGGSKPPILPTIEIDSGKESDSFKDNENCVAQNSTNMRSHVSLMDDDEEGDYLMGSKTLQWAQGKAGEDRVHVVISEENGWVFVGIYDGFNGPDAPDYLLDNLYTSVRKELKRLIWNDKNESTATSSTSMNSSNSTSVEENNYTPQSSNGNPDSEIDSNRKTSGITKKTQINGVEEKCEGNPKICKCEWERERLEHEMRPMWDESSAICKSEVLNALSQALRKTEDEYLEIADKKVTVHPELALMGSCVLVMLMKGEEVYVMNVGDSRAVLAQQLEPDFFVGNPYRDFERINEGTQRSIESLESCGLTSIQLTMDHSTDVEEEVKRIKKEHPDDAYAVMNDRVKGYLKITRAFGAGFLKQPKWNDALLEMFRIDYIGNSPYLTCNPSLYHYKLKPRDRFIILSSDGLFQYFTNEQAIAEVEAFLTAFPEGDPAQHLIEAVLFRAARKAGMDFHELLDIPQGERRKYHDDVSVIIISLEGRLWRSLL